MSILLLLFGTVIGMVQSAPVPPQISANHMALLDLDGTQRHPVLLSPVEAIHAADEPLDHKATALERASHADGRIYDNLIGVELSVVLNMNGRVESAKPLRGPERFYEQAVELEMHREFEPVRNDEGTIVPAHFTDYVSIYPPERWLDHSVPFPEKVDLRTFRITLERTGCMGSCPSYKVTVTGSGNVTWDGGEFVAVPGVHHASILNDAIRKLVDKVRTSRMLDAQDEYRAGWTDNSTYILTLDVNGLHKQVVDYIGPIVGMPTSIRELEEQIDTAAGTAKWIKADGALQALTAEHWNFGANSEDNIRLYDRMLELGNREVLAAFTLDHGPVFSTNPLVESPVCVASKNTDSHVALEMLVSVPKGRKLPQRVLDACLVDAARAGNLALVNLWLEHGASLTPAPLPESKDEYVPELDQPLAAAIQGGSPAVVQRLLDVHAPVDSGHNGGHNFLTYAANYDQGKSASDKKAILEILLQAGANPNEETDLDRPALFAVDNPELVSMLVEHGANVNLRDSEGRTPLMFTTDLPALKALLEAGADPTLRDREGQTAAEQFREEGLKEQADLLDAAVRVMAH